MSRGQSPKFDCIVIGGGLAGCCAALSADANGCRRVLIVEKAPQTWAGGNGYFTAGAHRTVHGGLHDLLPIVHNVATEQADKIDIEPYTTSHFRDDIMRLSEGKSDEGMVKALVEGSRETIEWLAKYVGVSFVLSFNRQAYVVDGRQKFWGGMALSVKDGGKGLVETYLRILAEKGIEIRHETPAKELVVANGKVVGAVVQHGGETRTLHAPAVILAAGGYEANEAWRIKHLGEVWENARVRGTPYNSGDGISLATSIGAMLTGDWHGCHSTCWDANAPKDHGDRILTNQFTKSGYPLGLMLNAHGRRFVDEGKDFRNYTYAEYGRKILEQPAGGIAFQVWDAVGTKWLREEEYAENVVKRMEAQTIQELAMKLVPEGLEGTANFVQAIEEYNAAVKAFQSETPDVKFDPAVKDGLSTQSKNLSLQPPKSNWALPISEPPFLAVKVSCGITFTFGGVVIDPETAGVISEQTGKPIEGLFATGEMVGGLFYNNYPGGSGLTAGAVFGRKAGASAARLAASAKGN